MVKIGIFSNEEKNFESILCAILLHLLAILAFCSISNPELKISDFSVGSNFKLISVDFSKDLGRSISSEFAKNNKEISSEKSDKADISKENFDPNSSSGVIFEHDSLNNEQPQYPKISKKRGDEGRVLLEVFVESDGSVARVELVKSSSYGLLDKAAIDAIKKWKFIPAKKFGQYISSSVLIPVTFKLNKNEL